MSRVQETEVKKVNISELVSSMTQELDYYWSADIDHGTEACIIYKIQQHIRDSDRFSYEPCIVSVGPYHYGSASLQDMQKVKWGYLDVIIRLNCQSNLLDYLTTVGALAKQARNCYPEDIKMDCETFLQMLLLDGCFILCSLGAVARLVDNRLECQESTNPQETVATEGEHPEHVKTEDTTTANDVSCEEWADREENSGDSQSHYQTGSWFIRYVNHDLLVLENQIPFFIVEKIFELVTVTVLHRHV